ncbi:helix-turn-helix domain-containing protein [Desmospora activa]|uniref:Cytoskeletal protein RodZ n=1 Tax=Desmospora activa DSM 45169 TaxID=1121389 RepID=A0A2T4ZAK1_9BACL|nr:helix-turn-helix domain-containing protein [Desmospora activa]PTM58922.1 cytoskeletal protein RodZ [Desmospora activa DSM 45169]
MSNPTDQLREARERAGLSLEDVQQRTKIQVQYLEAIEKGEFERLPGSFYARAFIRSYAEHVGVEPLPLVKFYEQETPTEAEENGGEQSLSSLSRRQRYARKSRHKQFKGFSFSFPRSILPKGYAWLLLVLFILLIPAVIYVFKVYGDDGGKEEAQGQVSAEAAQQEEDGDEVVVELVQPAETYEYGDVFEISNAEQAEVTLEAKGDTRFRYRAGGPKEEVTEEADLAKGQSKTFTHSSWVSIFIQNPDQVELTVNGHVIDTTEATEAQAYQLKIKK